MSKNRLFWKRILLLLLCAALCAGCRQAANAPADSTGGASAPGAGSSISISAAADTGTQDSTQAAADTGTQDSAPAAADTGTQDSIPDEHGSYTSRDEVALYLHTYGHLPDNYITKEEARALGWDAQAGNLQEVAPGKSIGGDRFGNREGLLPAERGRQYYECDIDYAGGTRNAKRIVYSNDGLIFYTDDHYASYTQLY